MAQTLMTSVVHTRTAPPRLAETRPSARPVAREADPLWSHSDISYRSDKVGVNMVN